MTEGPDRLFKHVTGNGELDAVVSMLERHALVLEDRLATADKLLEIAKRREDEGQIPSSLQKKLENFHIGLLGTSGDVMEQAIAANDLIQMGANGPAPIERYKAATQKAKELALRLDGTLNALKRYTEIE